MFVSMLNHFLWTGICSILELYGSGFHAERCLRQG
jgi:hypothetical protein